MKTIYLSGPMSGLPGFNFPAFHAAAAKLRADGFTVLNPAETDNGDTSKAWDTTFERTSAWCAMPIRSLSCRAGETHAGQNSKS